MSTSVSRLNYIGSKFQLLDWITTAIKETTQWTSFENKRIADLFAGTGIVSHAFRQHNAIVLSNDAELYSYTITYAFTRSVYTEACKNFITTIRAEMQDGKHKATVGYITTHYSPFNASIRKFFTIDNARVIDYIRARIEDVKKDITNDDYHFVLASLLLSADAVSNVPAVYGCFLHDFKNKAKKQLVFAPIHQITTQCQKDSTTFYDNVLSPNLLSAIQADAVYLDPPYNERQYSKNYFPLNMIAKTPQQLTRQEPLKGKTGIPTDCFLSPFCKKGDAVENAFDTVVRSLKTRWIFLSYNSESLVTKERMLEILGHHGTCSVIERDYKRFKSYEYNEDKEIKEYLFCLDKNPARIDERAHKKQMGQYFTISETLQAFVFEKVKHKGARLLEPSFGAGHLTKRFKDADTNYPMTCYELDSTIQPVIDVNEYQTLIYGDFTKQTITQRFKTIVGNPPYVKRKTGNLYIEFVQRCYDVLDIDGELIFIVPSDFIKVTSASKLIDTMTKHGAFTDFLFPHDETLFTDASIDVVVFRYEKGSTTKRSMVNGKDMFCNIHNGIITFSESELVGEPLANVFNVYVGLVSGRDEIYNVPFGNMDILNDKGRADKYIFTETFPTENTAINNHLLAHKAQLLERGIKRFSDANWFEWGAPRNIKNIRAFWGNPCIYVRNVTRSKEIAFIDTVQYFGGGLLCIIPKNTNTMTVETLKCIVGYLNSEDFQKDYLYAGRFKIGQKQLCNVRGISPLLRDYDVT